MGMHNLSGLKLFDKINSLENSMSVIFLTGRGNIPTSVKMIKKVRMILLKNL